MGFGEFLAALRAMRTQQEGKQASPDSWAGVDQDPWWVEQRALRDRERKERWGVV